MQIKVFLSMGLSNCRKKDVIEIDDDEFNECETQEEKDKLIEEYTKEWFWNEVDFGHEIIE